MVLSVGLDAHAAPSVSGGSAAVMLLASFHGLFQPEVGEILYDSQAQPHFGERDRLHFMFWSGGPFPDFKKDQGLGSTIGHGGSPQKTKVSTRQSADIHRCWSE
jgi:hypothetical protein